MPLFCALDSIQTHASGFRGLPVRTQKQVSRRGLCRVRMLLVMVPPLRSARAQPDSAPTAQIDRAAQIIGSGGGESDVLLLAHALKSQVECWMSGERIVYGWAIGDRLSALRNTGLSCQYVEALVRIHGS